MNNQQFWFSLVIIVLSVLSARETHLAQSDGANDYPVVLYAPMLMSVDSVSANRILADSIGAKILPGNKKFSTGNEKVFILMCEWQIAEFSSNSQFSYDNETKEIDLVSGTLTIHVRNSSKKLCFSITTGLGTVRYADSDSVQIILNDSLLWLRQGDYVLSTEHSPPDDDWFKRPAQDGEYLFGLIGTGKIPAKGYRFEFPSMKPPLFKHTTRSHTGIATKEGQRYYFAGILYKINLWEIEFVYDIWFAFARNGTFYNENWDEWKDFIDRIHYIQLYSPRDPFFMRVGLIENLTYGRGLLLSSYSNAVILPFEHHSGLEMRLSLDKYAAKIFINDIGYPRIFGGYFGWRATERLSMNVNYVGDFNQYSNIDDRDGDSYPDRTDPEPDVFNESGDSVIIENSPQRLDEIGSRQLHGIAAGFSFTLLNIKNTEISVYGEIAALSKIGAGLTFPNVSLRYRWVSLGAGLDFQSPNFTSGVFDRSYEYNKARFVQGEDGKLTLVSHASEIAGTDDWLYGWNYSFKVDFPGYVAFGTRFRDVYRGENRNKNFAISLYNEYPFSKYIKKSSIFIEQKNVSELFRKKTDGQSWGFEMAVMAHRTIELRLRYREQYQDDSGDGIIGSDETKRNFSGNIIINGNYWWKKFWKWARKD